MNISVYAPSEKVRRFSSREQANEELVNIFRISSTDCKERSRDEVLKWIESIMGSLDGAFAARCGEGMFPKLATWTDDEYFLRTLFALSMIDEQVIPADSTKDVQLEWIVDYMEDFVWMSGFETGSSDLSLLIGVGACAKKILMMQRLVGEMVHNTPYVRSDEEEAEHKQRALKYASELNELASKSKDAAFREKIFACTSDAIEQCA